MLDRVERLEASLRLEEDRVRVVLAAEGDRRLRPVGLTDDLAGAFEDAAEPVAERCVCMGEQDVDAVTFPLRGPIYSRPRNTLSRPHALL